jgi:hypothetical protein
MAGNLPGEMAENIHSCFSCKRILEHGSTPAHLAYSHMKQFVLLVNLLILCNMYHKLV